MNKKLEETKVHVLCLITFSETRAVYEIIWTNMVVPDRPKMTIHHGAWDFNVAHIWLQTHTQYM
jgi:BarA-like signal transduction histidine kinase